MQSNRLTVLADEIREDVSMYTRLRAEAIEAYMTAGRKLLEARELTKHGEWLPFLKRIGGSRAHGTEHDPDHRGRSQIGIDFRFGRHQSDPAVAFDARAAASSSVRF